MKVKWLFETDVFEDNTDKFIEVIKSKGMIAEVVPYVPFDLDILDRCNKLFDKDDCVVFYGSLNFGKKLKKASWVPGVYLNEKAFECTSYYPAIEQLLLHYDNFFMLPYGVLKKNREWVFDRIGNSEIFIRPNSGIKEFTGFVTTEERFDDDVKLAGFYDVEPDLLCLISSAKELIKEYRFVVVNGKVVSGSEYRDWTTISDDYESSSYVLRNSKHTNELCDDDGAWIIADACARLYNPDRAWTIDVAKTLRDGYRVLEIGCFSCAGMYGNDLNLVADAVSKAAEEEWSDIFE